MHLKRLKYLGLGRFQSVRGTNWSVCTCPLSYRRAISSAEIKGRAKFISKRMRAVQFAAFCHFLVDMFSIIGKWSLKMQSDDLILPITVSQLEETVAPCPQWLLGHICQGLKQLSNKDVKVFQGTELEGNLKGRVKHIGSGPSFNA